MNILHDRKISVLLITTVFVLLLTFGLDASSTDYEKFEALQNGSEKVYEECTCYGSIYVMQSYPPQYSCQGHKICSPANYTRSGN